ncbi:MAG: DNA-protecting protein DprA [Burkholderiales bacterium]|nr:DNA-protecting protein DprA [Burkholderiales bacterium]
MAERDEARYWLALSFIPGLGGETFRRLLSQFGPPDKIFCASTAQLSTVVDPPIARAISAGLDADRLAPALDWLTQPGNHLITLADAEYPQALLETPNPPAILYIKGRLDLLNQPALGIVGSRHATPQGARDAEAFAHALSDAGLTIVSGMALGIDASAHRGGLKGAASSIAVVGTGLDIVYPARNRELAHQLAEHGTIISEFPLGTPSKAQNFPRRNRIISGLARGVLVVEAALQSGSLITARLAGEQGREVFAIPGSIHSPLSKGCHRLIKQGAKLVESAQDILEELGWAAPVSTHMRDTPEPDQAYAEFLNHLGHTPTAIDALVRRTGLTSERVCSILLELELNGQVASLPGGLYQAIN